MVDLSYRNFRQTVQEYEPLCFEVLDSSRFCRPMHHLLKNQDRFWSVFQSVSRYLPSEAPTLVDFGPYPGSLLRLFPRIFDCPGCRLVGVGLMLSEKFCQGMESDCGAQLLRVNLDPRNSDLSGKGYPATVPLPDGCAHLAFALEVIEHLVSPTHLLNEAYRVLAPGGHLFVTTPNVTRIGNVLKLAVGRSNYDRLIPLDYERPEDEWRPHFREYTLGEVRDLLEAVGFEVIEGFHFLGHDCRYARARAQRLWEHLKRPFYLMPHFRTNLQLVGQKPAG